MDSIRHIAYSIKQRLAIGWALKKAGGVYRPVQIPRRLVIGGVSAVIAVLMPLMTTCLIVEPVVDEPDPQEIAVVYRVHKNQDPGLSLYRDELSREAVLSFYTDHVGDRVVAEAIAREASANDIPLALAYSLAWAESRFFPRAVNRNHSSVDRGLYQLNNKSFPNLSLEDFFDPEINAKVGLAYLRWCLNTGGDEVVALAMYNAGQGRVEGGGTPLMTLRHISDILEYRDLLEIRFEQHVQFEEVTYRSRAREAVS